VQTIFLALALYPEVQKKAQAEIDAVVGPNRLPDFHDRPSLPYTNAVLKELARWNLVTPFGRPFFITIIIINYYHPDEFRRCPPHVY
jgi:cytochrome P450